MPASPALAAYLTLPPTQRRMLALIAVAQQGLNRTNMAALLQSAGVLKESTKRLISTADLTTLCKRWCGLGLLDDSSAEGYGPFRVAAPLVHELLEHLRANGELSTVAALVRAWAPLYTRYSYGYSTPELLYREFVLSLYIEGEESPEALCEKAIAFRRGVTPGMFVAQALGTHVPSEVLQRFELPLVESYLSELFEQAVLHLLPVGEGPLSFVRGRREQLASEPLALAAAYLSLRGEAGGGALLAARDDAAASAARCLMALTSGAFSDARNEARSALAHTRAKTSKKLKGHKGWLFSWVSLALLTDTEPESLSLASEHLGAVKRAAPNLEVLHTALTALQKVAEGDGHVAPLLRSYAHGAQRWDEFLLWGLAAHIAEAKLPKSFWEDAKDAAKSAAHKGFAWVADELTTLPAPEERRGLTALYRAEEPWQRTLRALEAAITAAEREEGGASVSKSGTERLVWTLTPQSDGGHHLAARVQTALATGFSGGRQVTWKKLFDAPRDAAFLTPEDLRVIKHIQPPSPRAYTSSYLPDGATPLALVGHPRVFVDHECRQPVEVVRGAVGLNVQAEGEDIAVRLSPRACHEREVVCERDGDARVLVYALTPAQRSITEHIGKGGLKLPAQARVNAERVVARLVSHFPISSALSIDSANLTEVPADPRVHVALARTPNGLRVRCFVSPIGPSQTFFPGEGSESVLGTVTDTEGTRTVRTSRDLADERARFDRLLTACPSLSFAPDGARELRIEDLEACLELLAELRGVDDVVLVWAEGKPLEVLGERALRDVRLKLNTAEGWLSTEGTFEVDENLKLTFHTLLAHDKRHGRFVLLDDGRYLALTDELTRTLDALSPLARVDDEKVALHPLALLHLTELDVKQLKVDRAIKQQLTRLREASALTPAVPAAFDAELRPYQEEGYAWLSRLAHWGGGACLADDMGLGKTLQTLALLVEHAPRGPALVVAPTSVCDNWLNEARRFAPTLRVVRFSADREKTLRELGPFDVLVCSYGLLQQEVERLEKVSFQVAVLDEAQAIKNLTALRTKAALRLSAAVRIALTGTPVENHLGELYSLMRFLNPGLLGTGKQFEERFAKPVQRDNDRASAQRLKRLIRPFVLRRRKSEVLDDLPPKTEITLRIEPSDAERALYAAMREQALQRMSDPAAPAEARMRILAELTRLRRAACHPELVMRDGSVPSSKLAAFEELVDELRQGGHRALVFSQFVDHLTLVRQRLDTLGISYQYLDGSSSSPARAQAVAAFQGGQGDLFLISLKAGGFGLNLTAADYVVHLDPWWNPAVEDQASDRAHRIGQQRPVTVYRLVMQDSIEEKMLALHAQKRDLADALLEGNTSSAAMTVEQLVALVQEARTPIARPESAGPLSGSPG